MIQQTVNAADQVFSPFPLAKQRMGAGAPSRPHASAAWRIGAGGRQPASGTRWCWCLTASARLQLQGTSCLVLFEILKFYKISYHIEFFNVCMKY